MLVPVLFVDVVEHGARGVGGVGHVQPAAREFPDEPAIHRAKGDLAPMGPFASAVDVLQQPGKFGGTEIGINDETGLLLNQRLAAVGLECRAHRRSTPVLPYDGIVNRFTGGAVPQESGLALVRNSDADDVPVVQCRLGKDLLCHGQL